MKALRLTALFSYSLILLKGSMIYIPLIFWLLFTAFDFGTTDQIFALSGCVGLIISITNWKSKWYLMLLSLVLLLFPVVFRITKVGYEPFDYLGFQIPFIIFISSHSLVIFLLILKKITNQIGKNH